MLYEYLYFINSLTLKQINYFKNIEFNEILN